MNAWSYAREEFYRIRIIIYSAEGIQDDHWGFTPAVLRRIPVFVKEPKAGRSNFAATQSRFIFWRAAAAG
jgi:hypothetical protein